MFLAPSPVWWQILHFAKTFSPAAASCAIEALIEARSAAPASEKLINFTLSSRIWLSRAALLGSEPRIVLSNCAVPGIGRRFPSQVFQVLSLSGFKGRDGAG